MLSIGETLYSNAYGTQKLEGKSDLLTTDTPIWTSSLTKLVTTVACMIAVDQGLIGLDENIRNFVTELKDIELLVGFEESEDKPRKPILKDVSEPISLRYYFTMYPRSQSLTPSSQLLSHTSGFTYDGFDAGLKEWSSYTGRTAHSHCGSYVGFSRS